ncbi:hypothetical protein HY339_02920 [Candidatus Gottesmanbacteria bacterium]|nr:hypothetical protein [Candidatus Gottesmanbacteria bacterium]
MTEALKKTLGKGLYNTLAREWGILHPEEVVTRPRGGQSVEHDLWLTQEGVAALAQLSLQEITALRMHSIGPARSTTTYDALHPAETP